MSQCFAIMPYGKRQDADGKWIDFNAVYENIIEAAARELKLDCSRSDLILSGGSIYRDMFYRIAHDEVAIADLTTLNPNVLYELGVRHALCRGTTVILVREGTKIPFNLNGFRLLTYNPLRPEEFAQTKAKLKGFLMASLKSSPKKDSPIFDALEDLRISYGTTGEITKGFAETYALTLQSGKSHRIGIIGGSIRNARDVASVWVNPENTNMEMARPYDRAMSAVIRFEGAKKNDANEIRKDIIAAALRRKMWLMGRKQVGEAAVLVTKSGSLYQTHNVRRILHVAAAKGVYEKGYQPVNDLEGCVRNALSRLENLVWWRRAKPTIAFPLMGTGTSGGALHELVPRLVNTAISWLEADNSANLYTVYFVAFNMLEYKEIIHSFRSSSKVDLDVKDRREL